MRRSQALDALKYARYEDSFELVCGVCIWGFLERKRSGLEERGYF